MFDDIYDIYINCFQDYPITKDLFLSLLRPDLSHLIYVYENKKVVGFSLIHENSISLLCVEKEYRYKGFGTQLLSQSEAFIKNTFAEKIILGHGKYYLLQGVPADNPETISFFVKRNYVAKWTSVNMYLSLDSFNIKNKDIPLKPNTIVFRFAIDSDKNALLEAVNDAQPSWAEIFASCVDPIMLAMCNEKIVGFAILSPNGGRFHLSEEKIGSIGCVGVIQDARKKGIGHQMVIHGAKWLKEQDCDSIELRYVALVDWYQKIGFKILRYQWMGEKRLISNSITI